ncbi:MAG: hypothetical protein RL514_1941 [Verrucomicrobiota bacterium]|jgi:hypothetical protein
MKTSGHSNGQLLTVIALLALVAAGGWGVWRATRPEGSGASPHPYRVLGAGVGEEAGKLVGRNAQVVLIVAGGEGDPAAAQNAQSFSEALVKQGLKILATETIPLPDIAMAGSPGKKIPGQHYARIASQHANAAAVISLAGYPAFSAASPAPAKPAGPPFIAVVLAGLDPAGEGQELQRLLATGFVRLAITRQGNTVPTKSGSSSLRPQFDIHYQVLTPPNAAAAGK